MNSQTSSILKGILNEVNEELKKFSVDNPKKVEEKERYFKNKVRCYGNRSNEINQIIKNLKKKESFSQLSTEEKFELGLEFLRSEFLEVKRIGASILGFIHKEMTKEQFEELNKKIEEEKLINEWGTSDGLAIFFYKYYGLISKENAIAVSNLKDKKFLWLRRISLVSFITRVKHKDKNPNFEGFIDLMFETCEANSVHEERFNQLGLGWLLRELALVDYKRYKEFISNHQESLTRECIRYSVEKLDLKERLKIMGLGKSKVKKEKEKRKRK